MQSTTSTVIFGPALWPLLIHERGRFLSRKLPQFPSTDSAQILGFIGRRRPCAAVDFRNIYAQVCSTIAKTGEHRGTSSLHQYIHRLHRVSIRRVSMSSAIVTILSTGKIRIVAGIIFLALLHLTAAGILFSTEDDLTSKAAFVLTWILLNSLWIIILRRPAAAAGISLVMLVLL